MAMRWGRNWCISWGVGTDGPVMGLAVLLMGLGKGLLQQSVSIRKGLWCW